MKKKKILSFLLSLVMVIGLFPVVAMAGEKDETTGSEEQGVVLAKNYDAESSKLKLETYATGTAVVTEKFLPCDIVLVLDTSGSMDERIAGTSTWRVKTGNHTYNSCLDTQYFRKIGDQYFPVTSAARSDQKTYQAVAANVLARSVTTRETSTWSRYGDYFYKVDDTTYRPVYYKMENQGFIIANRYYCFAYQAQDGSYVPFWGTGTASSTGVQGGTSLSGHGIYTETYPTRYVLYYTNEEGQPVYFGNAASSTSGVIYTGDLYYQAAGSRIYKIDALQTAVNSFIDMVAANAEENEVDHKISIVRFASNATTAADMTSVDTDGVRSLKNKVANLSPDGATAVDYGMTRAETVLNEQGRKDTHQVVVLFTDGVPTHGSADEDFAEDDTEAQGVATAAVQASKKMKDKGVSVFSIGVFDNETAGIRNYMNAVSSNYPNATKFNVLGEGSDQGYYKRANDAGELEEVFKKTADAVISGGSKLELDATTELYDKMSNFFKLNDELASTEIVKAYWLEQTGVDEDGKPIFGSVEHELKNGVDGISIVVDSVDQSVKLSGFDFKTYYVELNKDRKGVNIYENHGRKVVVEISVIFTGEVFGSEVPTNDPSSGIYVGGEPVENYPVPTVDIPGFTVKHSGGGADDEIPLEALNDGTYDITKLVDPGYLYAGYRVGNEEGEFGTVPGTRIVPENGDVFYLVEVSADYLRPQAYVTYMSAYYQSVLTGIYPMTAINSNEDYQAVGFDFEIGEIGEDGTPETTSGTMDAVAEKFVVQNAEMHDDESGKTSDAYESGQLVSYKVDDVFYGIDSGYFYMRSIAGEATDGKGYTFPGQISFTPFWVTKDNVKVWSNRQCTILNNDNTYTKGNMSITLSVSDKTCEEVVVNAPLKSTLKSFSAFRVGANDLSLLNDDGTVSSTAGVTAEGTEKAEEPEIIEKPEVVEQPEVVEKPEVVEQPEVVEKPEVVEQPEVVEEPKKVEFTVTKVDGKNSDTQVVEPGNQVGRITFAAKNGQMFAGWFADAACTVPADFSNVRSDMTVYAKYVKPTVSVSVTARRSGSVSLSGIVSAQNMKFAEVGFNYSFKGQDGKAVGAAKSADLVTSLLKRLTGKSNTTDFAAFWNLDLANRSTFTAAPYWVTADGTLVNGAASTYSYTSGVVTKK